MNTISSFFGTLKSWQIAILILVVFLGAAAAYTGYSTLTSTDKVELASNQKIYLVEYGDLINQVSTNGSLVFPNKESLTFGSAGTVSKIFVGDGDTVKKGEQLAKLDKSTIASLEQAVAQKRVALANAKEALQELKNPNNALQIAQAYASIATGKISVRSAKELLEDVSAITDKELQDAYEAARLAQDKEMTSIHDLEVKRQNGANDIETVKEDFDTQEAAYIRVFDKWLGIRISGNQLQKNPDTLLAEWNVDLEKLFHKDSRYQDLGRWTRTEGPPTDDPKTGWNEAVVYSWLNLFTHEILPTCPDLVTDIQLPNPRMLGGQVLCIKLEMETAWENYQAAGRTLMARSVSAALAITGAETQLSNNMNSLDSARESLDSLLKGVDSLDVAVKEKQLKLNQAALAKAEDDLTELLSGVNMLDLALANENVKTAQVELEESIEKLAASSMQAPMSGVVSEVLVEIGQDVGRNTKIIEISDPSVVEVDGVVDEIDVLLLQEGTTAKVTMDALPGEYISGVVSFVSPTSRNQQGVVTYPIRIELKPKLALQLKEGLSATANVILREEKNVLLVRADSIYGTLDEPKVKVWSDGKIEERVVKLGNADGFWVAALSGLVEGEQVILETSEATTTGGFGFAKGFGGSFGSVGGSGVQGKR
jgi:RND family efflux transporter MFP subunit